jgi:hypothetical protein
MGNAPVSTFAGPRGKSVRSLDWNRKVLIRSAAPLNHRNNRHLTASLFQTYSIPALPFAIAAGWFLVLSFRQVWVVPEKLPWMLAEGLLWPMAMVYLPRARISRLAVALALPPLFGVFTMRWESFGFMIYGLILFELLFTLPAFAGVALAAYLRRRGLGLLDAMASAVAVVAAFWIHWLAPSS